MTIKLAEIINKKILIGLFIMLIPNLFAQNYSTYMNDLTNMYTIGYKTDNGLFEQGPLFHSEGNFAIMGNGFFKVYSSTGEVYYTRCGLLLIVDGKLQIGNEYFLINPLEVNKEIIKYKLSPNGTLEIEYIDGTKDEKNIHLYEPVNVNEVRKYSNYYTFKEVRLINDSVFRPDFLELSIVDELNMILSFEQFIYSCFQGEKMETATYIHIETLIRLLYETIISDEKNEMFVSFSKQSVIPVHYNEISHILDLIDFSIKQIKNTEIDSF